MSVPLLARWLAVSLDLLEALFPHRLPVSDAVPPPGPGNA